MALLLGLAAPTTNRTAHSLAHSRQYSSPCWVTALTLEGHTVGGTTATHMEAHLTHFQVDFFHGSRFQIEDVLVDDFFRCPLHRQHLSPQSQGGNGRGWFESFCLSMRRREPSSSTMNGHTQQSTTIRRNNRVQSPSSKTKHDEIKNQIKCVPR